MFHGVKDIPENSIWTALTQQSTAQLQSYE
jgi:hypothetical protein